MVRKQDTKDSMYFGPFPSTKTVKDILQLLRQIFPFDTQNRIGKRLCFWSHIGLCNPCPSAIEKLNDSEKKFQKTKYKKNIRNLIAVLSRKTDRVKNQLNKEMKIYSKLLRFEDAAKIRDQLAKLDYITREYTNISSFLENPNLIRDLHEEESEELTDILSKCFKNLKKISRIECFDASHTAMSSPTVGMITFVNGESDKNYYRRFKIKKQGSIDDLAFLEEALTRRFSHKEWGKPDLLVIDGGKTQLRRALAVLKKFKINQPTIGIVKPYDNIVIPHKGGFLIVIVKNQHALHLLQRVRDEAHRFAKKYHQALRSKRVYLT